MMLLMMMDTNTSEAKKKIFFLMCMMKQDLHPFFIAQFSFYQFASLNGTLHFGIYFSVFFIFVFNKQKTKISEKA